MKPKRAALRYHGGKFRLADRLVSIFPPHRVYTEAFGGGASVLMAKTQSYAECYNDLDGEVVNVFRVLQDRRKAARLAYLLSITPYARGEFEIAYTATKSDVERARRTMIRSFMGFGSDSITRLKASSAGFNTRISSVMSTGFRWNSNRSGTTPAQDWANFPSAIRDFTDRLQGVVIERRDAIEIIKKMDTKETLHYVDPPYPFSVRRVGNGTSPYHRYRYEMTEEDHERLSGVLHGVEGMVVISSYPGGLYGRLYHDWHRVEWTGGQFAGPTSGIRERTECAWMNPAAEALMPQKSLFVVGEKSG